MGNLYGNLACGENSRALRLENVLLRKPFSDLQAANANPIVRRAHKSTRTHGNLACGENSRACRWKMPRWRESLSDGFATGQQKEDGVANATPSSFW